MFLPRVELVLGAGGGRVGFSGLRSPRLPRFGRVAESADPLSGLRFPRLGRVADRWYFLPGLLAGMSGSESRMERRSSASSRSGDRGCSSGKEGGGLVSWSRGRDAGSSIACCEVEGTISLESVCPSSMRLLILAAASIHICAISSSF